MALSGFNPVPGVNFAVATGGSSVIAVNAGPNGGFIVNPFTNTDQGIAIAEPLYVNPVGPAGLAAYNTTFALQPGQSWALIAGQTTATYVNATTNGHRFSVVSW